MDRTIRPLVIIAAFSASLVVGLVIMLWAMGGLRTVTAPAAIARATSSANHDLPSLLFPTNKTTPSGKILRRELRKSFA